MLGVQGRGSGSGVESSRVKVHGMGYKVKPGLNRVQEGNIPSSDQRRGEGLMVVWPGVYEIANDRIQGLTEFELRIDGFHL